MMPGEVLARVAALLVEMRADGDLLATGKIDRSAHKAIQRQANNRDTIGSIARERGVDYDELVAQAKVWLIK